MSAMICPHKVALPLHRQHRIYEPVEEGLMKMDPSTWPPIVLFKDKVIDGMQRILIARKHNITSIPFRSHN
jgi:hypothetical protein